MVNILSGAAYFFRDILQMLCVCLFMRYAFDHSIKKRRVLVAVIALFLIPNSAAAVYAFNSGSDELRSLTDIISYILYTAVPVALEERPGRRWKSVAVSSLILDFTADVFYSFVAEIGNDRLVFESLFGVGFYALFIVFFAFVIKKGGAGFLKGAFRSIPKWAWAVLLFFEFTCYYREFGIALSWYKVFSAAAVAAVLFTLFFLMFRVLSFTEQQSAVMKQLSDQREYALQFLKTDDDLRSFRHDYKNHMIVVKAYLDSGDIKSARSYISGLEASSGIAGKRFETGNFAADAVLSGKAALAEKKGIDLRFTGAVPENVMSDEDMCAVLSNLLDNAVEAAEKTDGEKQILVQALTKNGFFLLTVQNPCIGGTASSSFPETTKSDKKNHGYGLKNVDRAVKKYGGAFTCESEDGTFSASVRIKV
ncbi:MAG: GHKL domain-containing protein [Clostridia bacterium]|nr:GHKL domain-containing protein [Clostridia bacterium]